MSSAEEDQPGVAVVTGAGTGIGRAVAARLARHGPLLMVGRRLDVLQQAAEAIGQDATVLSADLTRIDGIVRIAEHVRDRWGLVRAVVNNAGVFVPTSTGMSVGEVAAGLDRLLAVNLRAPFLLITALADMLQSPGGRIVNITSLAAHTGGSPAPRGTVRPGQHAGYAASKGGLHGLTVGLARELAPRGITVNSVAPGYVAGTEMTGEFSPERVAVMLECIPLGRAGSADEVAAAVDFLASSEASYVTGSLVMVNGGWVFGH